MKRTGRKRTGSRRLVLTLILALVGVPEVGRTAGDGSAYFAMGEDAELVAWRAWSPEIFAEARERGLPILLNAGPSWCHDCRRMTDTYSNRGVAAVINENFIPVKLDSDQAPHLAGRFQECLYEIRKATGIPLTGFLTGDGRLFVGGTYFAADDNAGITGLQTLARHVSRQYQEDKLQYHNTAEEIANLVLQSVITGDAAGELGEYDRVLQAIPEAGQWLTVGPVAPAWTSLILATELAARGADEELEAVVLRQLHGLADSGLRDLLAGGFHRAALDPAKSEPHYEKLLAVNAGLLEAYATAGTLLGMERFSRVADETLDYVLTILTDPAGGFFNSQAADRNPKDDGGAYSWTADQVAGALEGAQRTVAMEYFGLLDRAWDGGRPGRPLASRRTIAETAAEVELSESDTAAALLAAIEVLRTERAKRAHPPVDRSMFTADNAVAAQAALIAAAALGRQDALDQALRTLDRFIDEAWSDSTGFARGLRDGQRIDGGLLRDQVLPAQALLTAYQLTGMPRYLEVATAAVDGARKRHQSPSHPGLLDMPAHATSWDSVLIIPVRPVRDGFIPGGNAIYAMAELTLGKLAGEDARVERAAAVAKGFAGSASQRGVTLSTMARVANRLGSPPPLVTVVAAAQDPNGMALAQVALIGGGLVSWREPSQLRDEERVGLEDRASPVAWVLRGELRSGPFATPQELLAEFDHKYFVKPPQRLQGVRGPIGSSAPAATVPTAATTGGTGSEDPIVPASKDPVAPGGSGLPSSPRSSP